MRQLTIRYFQISILLMMLVSCKSQSGIVRTADAESTALPVWYEGLRSETEKNAYRVSLKADDNEFNGLCMIKKVADGWHGTFVNEFGIKAFDFSVNADGCELLNVVSMMDKWYIRKTVAEDLHFLFEVDDPKASFGKRIERFVQNDSLIVNYKKKQIVTTPDRRVKLTNRKHNITYLLYKMPEIDRDKIIM